MRISIKEIGPRSERHLVNLVTVHAHNELNRVQEKLLFHMVVRVVNKI